MDREKYIKIRDKMEGIQDEAHDAIHYFEAGSAGDEDLSIRLQSILTTVKEIQGLLADA